MLALVLAAARPASAADPILATNVGQLRGIHQGGSDAFRGAACRGAAMAGAGAYEALARYS